MNNPITLILSLFLSITSLKSVQAQTDLSVLKQGDIIFHTSLSSQSKAIQLATHSTYSHVGMLFKNNGKWFVFEAIQPVTATPLKTWIKRGENQTFVIKRLKSHPEGFSAEQIAALKKASKPYYKKNYDLYFGWDDSRIYCSELVWKVYQNGLDIQLCELKTLSEFDLTAPAVKQKMKERYGNNIPLQELVVAPEDLFQSELLEVVNFD